MSYNNEQHNQLKFRYFVLFLTLAILGGAIVQVGINAWSSTVNNHEVVNTETVRVVDEQDQVIDVVKNASPSVVSIIASAEVPTFENSFSNPIPGLPEQFQQFFNIPSQRQNGTEKKQVGAGTGFIVSADGYIITNKHVVADEEAEYTVYLNDEEHVGEKIVAKVLARDPNNDLAVLKIDKTNLPYLEFGNSDDLQVGQTAITIGYALGQFDNTVSKGVVSGLSRTIVAGGSSLGYERLSDLIQSDAAINPGNSGGPMLNLSGQVIGVNVAMASAENIGFAILGNEAKSAFEEVRDTGTIVKDSVAFLGVRYTIIDENMQANNNLPYDYGALVVKGDNPDDLAVVSGSPADKAGITENDIILEVDGKKINDRNLLSDVIVHHKPGDEINIKFYHKGEERDVNIQLSEH